MRRLFFIVCCILALDICFATNHVLFGLYKERYGDNLYLLVINMKETTNDVIFSLNKTYNSDSIRCNTITRMFHMENSHMENYTDRTKIILSNMLGGECAILHINVVMNQ